MRKIKIIILISASILIILSANMVFANENTYNVSGDEFNDIQTVIDHAETNDIIELDGEYNGDKQIKITKSLTIQSNGKTILDGKNDTRLIYIEKANVTFKNIIFKNGVSNEGGAVYSLGNCIFKNCTFINNYAKYGGAIYSNANLTIIDSNFMNNGAKLSGGAIYCEYKVNKKTSSYGDVNILNSNFTNNNADCGGAISIYLGGDLKKENNYALISVKNSRFNKNSAEESGGAIKYTGSEYYGELVVVNTDFNENYANQGSSIEVSDCNLTSSNNVFSKNTGYYGTVYACFNSKVNVKYCLFENNSADAVSAFMLYSSDASLVECEFLNNSVATINSYQDSRLTITKGKYATHYKKRIVLDNSLKLVTSLTVNGGNLISKYRSYDNFTIQLIDKNTKKPMDFFNINLQFKSNKKVKTFRRTTNENGKVSIFLKSNLPAGKYIVSYISDDWGNIDLIKHTVTVKKSKAIVKSSKLTVKHQKATYFKFNIKDKYNEGVNRVKVKVKVFSGKNIRIYHIKTNYNGHAKLNIKYFKKGLYKVLIESEDANYNFNGKSKIRIK